MTSRSTRRHARSVHRRLKPAILTVLVLALTGGTTLLPASPSSATELRGTLTRESPTATRAITTGNGILTAKLRFHGSPSPRHSTPLTARVTLRDDSGVVVARGHGPSPVRFTSPVAAGHYTLKVRSTSPLRKRELTYTLRTKAAPSATTPPAAGDVEQAICGTWVLYQVSSATDLQRLRTHIDAALALPGVVGLSVRFPWDAADLTGNQTTNALLDEAADIAHTAGKALSIRFMAGAHTPQRVFDAGASSYLRNGHQVPLPWDNATGSHQVFLNAYADYVTKLATWSTSHDVHLLHLSWYGQDWAELNHGAEVRAAPGYTEKAWLDGHRDLIDVGARFAGPTLAVELPLSGYGPLSGGQSAALADYITTLAGTDQDHFLIQANGWDETQEWGSPSTSVETDFDKIWAKPLTRGLQMIQPDGYDWSKVFARLDATNALYGEIYLPSFWQVPGPTPAYSHNTTTRITQLQNEIKAFSQSRCG